MAKAAKTYHIAAFLWDNGVKGAGQECHGYIDHGTGKYVGNSEAAVKVLTKAWNDESAGYTLDTVYNSAPKN